MNSIFPVTGKEPEAASGRMKPLTLRDNFAWTTCGNIIYSLCSWLILTVIAKLGDTTMVGQFALSLAVIQPVIAFSQLNLGQVQMTDARREYRFGDYLGLRLITNAVALTTLILMTFHGGYGQETGAVILITGVGLAFDAIGDVTFGLLRQHERMDRIAISMAAEGVLSLVLLTTGLVVFHSIVWAAAGSALASALVALAYDIPNAVWVLRISDRDPQCLITILGRFSLPKPHGDLRMLARLAWLALPLGTIMLLIALNNNISRYFVEHYLGVRELGIFSALISFVAAGRIVTLALGQSATPRLARYYAEGNRQGFISLLLRLLLVGAACGLAAPVVALVAGRQILTFFYTPEYARHLDVFVIFLAAGGAGYLCSFLGYGITAARYFKIQTVTLAAVTAVTAATCAWLVPAYGLRGAAWSAVLVSGTQVVINLIILRHVLKALPASSRVELPTPLEGSAA